MMEQMRAEGYTLRELCTATGLSPSGYYKWRARRGRPCKRELENRCLTREIRRVHADAQTRCYGSPRMARELAARGLEVSENRVARLMRVEGIAARARRPFRPKTTTADGAATPSPNHLAERGIPENPGEVLVSDITYVATREGWRYLAVVIDLFSRAVVGWAVSESLATGVVLAATRRATSSFDLRPGAIFHSDRGCQYTSAAMRARLRDLGLRQSMSAQGYCYDNAACESFFASLKAECFPEDGVFGSGQHARSAIFEYIETFYNRRRLHSSLGYIPPHAFLENYFQKSNPNLN